MPKVYLFVYVKLPTDDSVTFFLDPCPCNCELKRGFQLIYFTMNTSINIVDEFFYWLCDLVRYWRRLFFFVFLPFLEPLPWHMEVPRLGAQSEP